MLLKHAHLWPPPLYLVTTLICGFFVTNIVSGSQVYGREVENLESCVPSPWSLRFGSKINCLIVPFNVRTVSISTTDTYLMNGKQTYSIFVVAGGKLIRRLTDINAV